MEKPGRLLASGRDADIFEYGRGAVLRRARTGRSLEGEARIMGYVRDLGYPVPEVLELSDDGCSVVLERIVGPNMLDSVAAGPWRLRAHGRTLASLHRDLHALRAPPWLGDAPVGRGAALVHLDLHPLNVLMSRSGPVVIDWANAARGDPSVDVCLTWALLASGNSPTNWLTRPLIRAGRGALLSSFLRPLRPTLDTAVMGAVVEWKAQDPHLSAEEVARMRALT